MDEKKTAGLFSPEVRERAMRLVRDQEELWVAMGRDVLDRGEDRCAEEERGRPLASRQF